VPPPANRLLLFLAALALLAFAAAALYLGNRGLTAAGAHLVLAVALLPLILGAMTWFTPVLTRARPARGAIRLLPLAALVAGLLVVAGLVHWLRLVHLAAALALAVVATLAFWMHGESRRAIGGAHPGLAWYLAALGCLALALLAVLATWAWPSAWLPARRLHLHLNLLGFVGLTAIGTLQVLLPTAGEYRDEHASVRLARDLKYALGGTLLASVGAAWWAPLSLVGLVLWLVPVVGLGAATLRRRARAFAANSAAASLSLALLGFALLLVAGGLHALAIVPAQGALGFFFLAFLFPLVTGAVTHLLPLWSRPGAPLAEQARGRAVLARGAALRGAVFVGAGVLWLADLRWAAWLAAATLAVFLVQALAALRRPG